METDQTFLLFLRDFLPEGVPIASLFVACGLSLFLSLLWLGIALLRHHLCQQQLRESRLQLEKAEAEARNLRDRLNGREVQLAQLSTSLENERAHHAEKLRMLESARDELRLQFKELAADILDDGSSKLTERNREQLSSILAPFNEKLADLKAEISQIYHQESRERISLKQEILQLKETNLQMNREAANLTRALKGDKKLQGDWGEVVLERILERSGLRRGIEYQIQASFRDSGNRLKRPDVIVQLPEGRQLVIDSKVSLVNWEKCLSSEDEGEKARYLKLLCDDLRRHILDLGSKSYPELPGISSVDFVLMFIPIEPIFHAAFSRDEQLTDVAAENNVVVVSPTTLPASLKTVAYLWRSEQQNRNVLEIARRAGIMHDKFLAFVEELEKLGRQLTGCRNSYELALKRLATGKGNLVSQSKQIRELGIKASRELPESIEALTDE